MAQSLVADDLSLAQQASFVASEEVRAYVLANDLEDSVERTLELTARLLPDGSSFSSKIQGNGESEESFLVLDLIVNSPRGQVFDHFERFVDHWVETVPKIAQQYIRFTYSIVESPTMDEKIDEVKFLAIWLHGAAKKAGQLDSVRKLIRSAMDDARDMYGLPEEDEPEDDPNDIPTVIGKFAASWDEFDQKLRGEE